MRTLITSLMLAVPALLASQSASAPLTTSGAVKTVEMKPVDPKTVDGGASNPKMGATQFLAATRDVCQLVTNDGKLFAACDNTTARGEARLPRTLPDWQKFASRLHDADREVNGKPRGLAVLNNGVPMVELTRDGRVMPKK